MNELLKNQSQKEDGFNLLTEEREFAEQIKERTHYAGFFVDREELYKKAPAHLEHTIERPHVTTKFAPGVEDLHIDELGSRAKIIAVGYGNDGKNEGLLVKVIAEDTAMQVVLDKIRNPHITLSYSDESYPMYTPEALGLDADGRPVEGYVEFAEDEQFEIDGRYGLYMKSDNEVVFDRGNLENYLEN